MLFLPINFGLLAMPIKYPLISFQLSENNQLNYYKGWMLNRDSIQTTKSIILYSGSSNIENSSKQILVIKKDSIANIHILSHGFIFPVVNIKGNIGAK